MKFHFLFEQSGTFKNVARSLGYEAYDYDCNNDFGETDFVLDLFDSIDNAFTGFPSVFDKFRKDDIIMAFFPCTYFCQANRMMYRFDWAGYKGKNLRDINRSITNRQSESLVYATRLRRLIIVCMERGLRLIIENPWTSSLLNYLSPISPTMIDGDRTKRGDLYEKPTAYWFINIECKCLLSYNRSSTTLRIADGASSAFGISRSLITPEYARAFLCDSVLGIPSGNIQQLELYDNL